MEYEIKDLTLAQYGERMLKLAREEMPGLLSIIQDYAGVNPLAGARIAGCLHMTSQTALLMETLVALGAQIRWCSSNRYSTQDNAAAAMAKKGYNVFAWHGETEQEFEACKTRTLFDGEEWFPNMLLDDGAELSHFICRHYPHKIGALRGISEETTSGVVELNQLYRSGLLTVPSIVINNSITKTKFDNIYGCKESLIDAIKFSTDFMIAGKTATIVGYGDVGKGCAKALSSMGAHIQIVEVDPISALQACMEGYRVRTLSDCCRNSHLFVTATGNINVITLADIRQMKDKVLLCNMGNFNNEIDMTTLDTLECTALGQNIAEYNLGGNKTVRVLGHGAPANLSCAKGHPSFVMSTSFCNQVFAQIELWNNASRYPARVNSLPRSLDERVASLHLSHLGAELHRLSEEQALYMGVSINGPFKPESYRY